MEGDDDAAKSGGGNEEGGGPNRITKKLLNIQRVAKICVPTWLDFEARETTAAARSMMDKMVENGVADEIISIQNLHEQR